MQRAWFTLVVSKSYMYVSEVKYTGYVDSVCVCGGDSVI